MDINIEFEEYRLMKMLIIKSAQEKNLESKYQAALDSLEASWSQAFIEAGKTMAEIYTELKNESNQS